MPHREYQTVVNKLAEARAERDALKAECERLNQVVETLGKYPGGWDQLFMGALETAKKLRAENARLRAALEDAQKWVFHFREQPEDNDDVLEQHRTNCRQVQKIISTALGEKP